MSETQKNRNTPPTEIQANKNDPEGFTLAAKKHHQSDPASPRNASPQHTAEEFLTPLHAYKTSTINTYSFSSTPKDEILYLYQIFGQDYK
uniref:Uncharacterized protein n=1 Tax=Arion vulgaris TaxID=1028688 RepID=A0A0B6ZTB0_9EUPU